MNGTLEEPMVWSTQKRALAIAIAVAVQVILIYWFSEKAPLQPRAADLRPAIQLIANAPVELLHLTDPTLFARAHPRGFSGPAWLAIPEHSYLPPEKPGEPLWLSPPRESLGATFQEFVKSYAPDGVNVRSWQPPAVSAPTISPSFLTIPPSQLRIEGPLAARGLMAIPKLPAWTNADVLAPSRVRVLVDARGNPISAVLLNSSGLKAADQRAVEIARDLRFGADQEALTKHPHDADAGLATGWVIFSWRTLAPPNTNLLINPR